MKLADLKARGAFVAADFAPREIVWKHKDEAGNEVEDVFTVHVRKPSFGDYERIFAPKADGKDAAGSDERSRSAQLISACIRFGENADECVSYEDAYRLETGLAGALLALIDLGEGDAKN